MTVSVSLVILSLFSCAFGNPANLCSPNFSCMPVSDCQINLDDYVVYPCKHGKKICCPILDNQNSTSKITNEFELISSTDSLGGNEKSWNSLPNTKENLSTNDGYNFDTRNVNPKIGNDQNQEFARNASSSGFISNRPVFNYYPNDPKRTTPIPITASFEHVRSNIPDYNTEFNGTYPRGTQNVDNFGGRTAGEEDFSVIKRRSPFKDTCGLTFADNKVTGGKVAEIGQFPWMALLAFRQAAQPDPQFMCGGTSITARHISTAAHCIVENRPLELIFVRLGEYNLTSQRDCVSFGNDRITCADQHVDVPVEHVTVHPEYSRKTLKNDIAVIRLRYEVRESDYIRAICLPFNKKWSYSDLTGQNFTVSGWGKTQSGNLFGSDISQFAKVTTWDQYKCNSSIPTQVKPLSETQICANGHNTEDACKGDSGGPSMNITSDKTLEVRHIQFGIVSFGTATCGDKNSPTIYTRVDTYLKWILETVT